MRLPVQLMENCTLCTTKKMLLGIGKIKERYLIFITYHMLISKNVIVKRLS